VANFTKKKACITVPVMANQRNVEQISSGQKCKDVQQTVDVKNVVNIVLASLLAKHGNNTGQWHNGSVAIIIATAIAVSGQMSQANLSHHSCKKKA